MSHSRRALLGGKPDPEDAAGWIAYIRTLFCVGFAASMAIAAVMHVTVERPCLRLLSPRSARGKTE